MALGCDGVERNVCFENGVNNVGRLVTDATSIMLVEKYEAVFGLEEASPQARRQMLRGGQSLQEEDDDDDDDEEEDDWDKERRMQTAAFCDCKRYPTICFWDAWCPGAGSGMYRKRSLQQKVEETAVYCEDNTLEGLLFLYDLDLPVLHSTNEDCLAGLQCKLCWYEESAPESSTP